MTEYHIIVQANAKPGKEEELRAAVRSLIAPSRAEAGCRRYIPYESAPGRFYFDEIWDSEAALELHANTPHFLKVAARFPELLEGGLKIDVVEEFK